EPARAREILLARDSSAPLPRGFRGYLLHGEPLTVDTVSDVYVLEEAMRYLAHGDIVRIDGVRRSIAALFRQASASNSFLVTERCDNYCVMCSQPPKTQDDFWIVDELKEVISLMSPDTREIGFTG